MHLSPAERMMTDTAEHGTESGGASDIMKVSYDSNLVMLLGEDAHEANVS